MVSVLAVFAHPDDETILAGGTLALLARQGAQVHYLCATRGEGGESGEPPLCTRAELGQVRQQEMACAVQALGGSNLRFLDYQDPLVGPENTLFAYTEDLPALAEQIARAAREVAAHALITHGSSGEYGHPAHVLTHQAVLSAVERMQPAPAVYSIDAFYPEHPKPHRVNKNDPADLVLDVSPVLGQKIQAALCHRTQHALFVRRASEAAGRKVSVPEVIIAEESLHRRRLPNQGDADPLRPLLESYRIRRSED
jgi:N-acetylglucosamine malate deacetylase 2